MGNSYLGSKITIQIDLNTSANQSLGMCVFASYSVIYNRIWCKCTLKAMICYYVYIYVVVLYNKDT